MENRRIMKIRKTTPTTAANDRIRPLFILLWEEIGDNILILRVDLFQEILGKNEYRQGDHEVKDDAWQCHYL